MQGAKKMWYRINRAALAKHVDHQATFAHVR